MARSQYEIALEIGGRINSSLGRAMRNYHNNMNNMNRSTSGVVEGIKNLTGKIATLGATAGAVAVAGIGAAAISTDGYRKALNGVESATGKSKQEMEGMREAMLGIYKNNFGENFEEIGDAMEIISQQTKQSGKELQKTTEIAFLMRDTFKIEVSEGIRSANQLMKNFGIDSKQAYNLMSQGAQSGLNANENLADTINEYSLHFSQLGLGAEDMFNMLSNGAESGVYDIDKLGDAMMEFGIRSKDGSKASLEAFKSLGLNSKQMTKDFSKGSEKGKKAFELVAQKLNNMKDLYKQNAIGVALFGTKWEDVGAKGILALTKTQGEINKTKDALAKINNVKYNTFGEAMTGIGRQLNVGLIIPLSEHVLPYLDQFSAWSKNNMPDILSKITEVAVATKDFAKEVVNFVDDYSPLIAGISAGALVFGTYTLAIKATAIATTIATGATGAFGAVLAFVTSPIGIAVLAIGALVAVGVLLYKNWDKVSSFIVNNTIWLKNQTVSVFNSVVEFLKEWGPTILAVITGPIGWIVYAVVKNWDTIKEKTMYLKDSIFSIFSTIGEFLSNVFKNPVNIVIGLINSVLDKIRTISIDVPDFLGGQTIGFNIPNIPELYKGTSNFQGGMALVGERGAEIVNLPRGSQVKTASKTEQLLKGSSSSTQSLIVNYSQNISITGNADKRTLEDSSKKSLDDLEKMMDRVFQRRRRLSF